MWKGDHNMSLTPAQFQDIMNQYDRTRQENYRISQQRFDEIYAIIPEIREIDQKIASESLAMARKMLFQPEIDRKSSLHEIVETLVRRKRELLVLHHYPADYLDPIYNCSFCKDTGYVDDQKCFCFEQKILDILYHQSNLMDAIRDHNFDTFRLDYYSSQIPAGKKLSPRDNMQQILTTCHNFIQTFDMTPGQNLLIYGNPGVGKTFLTTCIAGEILKLGKSVLYLTSYQLFEQLARDTFHREEHATPLLPALMNTDLLIIDDLGTEMNNAFINSQLFSCINERILKKKSTIISTNFSLKQLNQTYTERISSRMIQFYTLLHIYGEDIRIKKAFCTID